MRHAAAGSVSLRETLPAAACLPSDRMYKGVNEDESSGGWRRQAMEGKKEITTDDIVALSDQQLDGVSGGFVQGGPESWCKHKFGPAYKSKSLFGWNWYHRCTMCGREEIVELGPWSGDPD